MEVFEANVGLNLFLFLGDQMVATLEGETCSNETADLFCDVRENLELIFHKEVKRIDCGNISNQTHELNIKHVQRAVERHLEDLSWTNEDGKYWYKPDFSKRGLALYECIFIRYSHDDHGIKTPIYTYHVVVINDADCADEVIKIATRRVDRNTVIANTNETIEFSTLSVVEKCQQV
jgi:hypothetical protein